MQTLILGWLASHWLLIAAWAVGIAALANPVLVWKFKAWILLAVVAWWGWTGHAAYDHLTQRVQAEAAKTEAQIATLTLKASEAARAEEKAKADAVNAVATAYERGKTDAKANGERVAADLRAGNLRLRDQWRGCEARGVSGTATGAGEPAGSAELRATGAGDLVRAAAEADAWIRALQSVTQADRGQVKP